MSPTSGPSRVTYPRAIPTGSSSLPKPGNNRDGAGAMSRWLRNVSKSVVIATLGFAATMPLGASDVDPLRAPDTQLEPIQWSDIDGWANDDHAAAFGAFRVSCNPFLARRASADSRPIHQALREVCRRAAAAGALDNDKD